MTNNYLDMTSQSAGLKISQNDNDEELDLNDLFAVVLDGKYTVLAIFLIFFMLGMAKAVLDTPIYRADAMLQVQDKSSSIQALETVDFFMESNGSTAAEMEIAKSRKVLGETVKALNLDIAVNPRYFPLFGKAIARRFENSVGQVSEPWFGLDQYAWGGEEIAVNMFDVPEDWMGKAFTLVAGEQGCFLLFIEGQLIHEGSVGDQQVISLADNQSEIKLNVALLKARSGTEFILMKKKLVNAINELNSNFSVAEKVRNTGILNLTLESASPLLAAETLRQLSNIYVQENVQQKFREAEKSLEFLDKQLPAIKDQLEAAVTALNDFKTKNSSIDLNIETQNVLAAVVENKRDITLLQEKKDELRAKFTEFYPAVVALDKQIARLQGQIASNERKIEVLPEMQRVILRLTRDVEVSTALYTTLLNNAQTLRVAKAGTIGNVTIIDEPVVPSYPIKPNKPMIVVLASILGLIMGLAVVFVRKALLRGIQNPDQIEKILNIPVYSVVPHSDAQSRFNCLQKKLNVGMPMPPFILGLANKEDSAMESLRSLRTTLQFAFLGAKNNIIMIAGASSESGKTFIASNLAVVLADAGKKILLIDADLRKGSLYRHFGVGRENGLTEYISGVSPVEKIIQKIESASIDFISTGIIPPNPAELLLHERFGKLLESLAGNYEYIIIDSPPILTVTDASIIASKAGVTLMVVKAGHDSIRELEQSIKRLAQSGVSVKGAVFNDLPKTAAKYGDGYVKYEYRYNYKS